MSENDVFYYFMEGLLFPCVFYFDLSVCSIFSGIVAANTFSELFIDKCYKRFDAIVILIIQF